MKNLEVFDLEDADVKRIAQILAEQTGKNETDKQAPMWRRYGLWTAAIFLLALLAAIALLRKIS